MRAQDVLLNSILKAVQEYNKESKSQITPLQALKIYCRMEK